MDYAETWQLLKLHWKTLVVVGLLGSILGSTLAFLAPREFVASAQVFVATSAGSDAAELAQGGNYSQQQAKNYSNIVKSELVLQPVITSLSLEMTTKDLAHQVSTTVPLSTSIITVSVTDDSPERAAIITNSIMASLSSRVAKLSPAQSDGLSSVRVQVIQSAIPPTIPSSPNVKLNVGIGLILGLLLGTAFLIVRNRVNNTVLTPLQVRSATQSTLLGKIEFDALAPSHPLLTESNPDSKRMEQLRQIRTNLGFLQPGQDNKLLVVTSSVPNEGKSTISANLAITLASLGKRVCLVDADLRNSTLANILDLDGSVGLTSVLSGQVALDDAFQYWGPDEMTVLMAGDIPPNPSELLDSLTMRDTLESLNKAFDVTIVDTPPVLPVTDGVIVGQESGGVILVVGSGKLNMTELKSCIDILDAAQTPILGTIFNFAPEVNHPHYGGNYGRKTTTSISPPIDSKVGGADHG